MKFTIALCLAGWHDVVLYNTFLLRFLRAPSFIILDGVDDYKVQRVTLLHDISFDSTPLVPFLRFLQVHHHLRFPCIFGVYVYQRVGRYIGGIQRHTCLWYSRLFWAAVSQALGSGLSVCALSSSVMRFGR